MGEATRAIEFVDAAVADAQAHGLAHLNAQDLRLDGRCIRIDERTRLNFASCSYLGLELDARLKAGAIDAVQRYGTQFSSSRTYVSAPPYEELEALLDRIFQAHTLVTPSTTLSHFSALPVLVEEHDAVILDHQVHQSVQMAMPQIRQQGTHVEIVRHGRLDLLESRVRELAESHRRVWYLVDGIYSMYGDLAPLKALSWLLARHQQLQLYIDDAHGMSWCGRRGRGFAAEQLAGHERVTIAVSLNKAFGAAGGALVFPNAELRRKVRSCGGPMIFTGPVQPPMLGAALASARIHLSPEIDELQQDLQERIRYANHLAAELDLPLVSRSEVPIRYVGLGLLAACYDMTSHLLERGVFVNPAAFPAVGTKYAGIRFTLTRHQSLEDIRRLLEMVAERLPISLAAAGTSREEIDRTFKLEPAPRPRSLPRRSAAGQLSCRHEDSIRALDAAEWDACLGGRGTFDGASLALLEDAFGPEQAPENRWKFHYYVVRDGGGRPLLATFFTEALWKDDLLAAARVSQAVEERRERDRFFLTSRSLAMGSLLTEGEHLYLDRSGDWRAALGLLLDAVGEQREECESPTVVLRDMRADDVELAAYLKGAGFLQLGLPPSMEIDIDWRSREEFLAARTRRERRFHRERVIPWEDAYEVEVLQPGGRRPSEHEWRHLHALYRNVQGRNLALNTFPLPEDLLPRLLDCPGWEILLLTLRPEHGGRRDALPHGLMAGFAGRAHYVPVVTGMDYAVVESHGLYRQLLSQTVQRAGALGARRVFFGMGAELEKVRFGARPAERVMYVQSHDRFHHDVLTLIASDPGLQRRR